MAGSTSPTNGDSTISQTVTAPTGSSTLSFWYRVVCPDTVTYDWATATLKDNTTGTTTTILAKTCTNTGSWSSVSAAVTAGHSYTLTLTSHDDNYPSDPTYTLFDDVAIN
jgi:serine protease